MKFFCSYFRKRLAIIAAFLSWFCGDLSDLWTGQFEALAEGGYYTPAMPQDLEKLEISMLTVGLGPEIYQLWGHTAIRLKDPESKTDVVAHWGFFDFNAPNFTWNFFRGILTYRFGFQSYDETIRTYVYENRPVWEDHLNLTVEQKRRLMTKLIWNAQPENRPYRYYYFFDNCSTRPRDYLDEALGGAFKERFGRGISDDSFRDMVRQHMAPSPFSGMSLDVLMNSRLDRPMTAWEEMFLPLRLRRALEQMPAIDDAGKPKLGENLLQQGKQILTVPAMVIPRYNGFHMVVIPFAMLLCIALAAAGIQPKPDSRFPWRVLGLVSVLWGGLFGSYGAIMAVAWAASEHLDLQHNANLWLFWPTDLALIWFGGKLLIKGPRPGWIEKMGRRILLYGGLHLISFALLLALGFLGIIAQNTQLICAYFGPLLVFFWGLSMRLSVPKRNAVGVAASAGSGGGSVEVGP